MYNAKPFHYIKDTPKYNEPKCFQKNFRYIETRQRQQQMNNEHIMLNIHAKPYDVEKKIYTNPNTGQHVTFLPTARNLPIGYKTSEIEKTIRFVKNLKKS